MLIRLKRKVLATGAWKLRGKQKSAQGKDSNSFSHFHFRRGIVTIHIELWNEFG
jgi:hypothetical protein